MTIYVDLSHVELSPPSVVQFIEEQAAHKLRQSLLFKVSRDALTQYRTKLPSESIVKLSQDEVDEINSHVKNSWTVNDWVVRDHIPCRSCGRILNFYDVFQTGRKRHGNEYVVRFLTGREFHVLIRRYGDTIEVDCTSCDTSNKLFVAYDGASYCCGSCK